MGTKDLRSNPLNGYLSGRTATLYRLDPTGRLPVARLGEIFGAFNPNKISIDMITSEGGSTVSRTTDHSLESYADATTAIRREPETRTIGGLLTSTIPIPLVGGVGAGGILSGIQSVFGVGLRPDLIMLANLRAMQARGEPVAVATPRWSRSPVWITSIADSWAPGAGESIRISITVKDARILSPLDAGAVVPDLGSIEGGNYASGDAGYQPGAVSQATASGGGPLAAPVVSSGAGI